MKIRILIFMAFLAFVNTAWSSESVRVTGIFTSLQYNEEGGDLLGEEIFITYGGQGNYFASVQCAQGGIRAPFIVKVLIEGNHIEFVVPDSNEHLCASGIFKGTITTEGLSGVFTGANYKVSLLRGKSHWQ